MAQQWYFCVSHVRWCVQTVGTEEPPAGCLKTLALPHKARSTELQQTLYSMASNVHIVIHLEPAAPDVNKQYNFPLCTLRPPSPIHHNLFLASILCTLSFCFQTFLQIPSLCTRCDGMLCSLL